MTVVGDRDELRDQVILTGSQRPAIGGALWFGMFAVLYALFEWEMYICFAFVMWAGNRSPTISKKLHVIVMVFIVLASVVLSLFAILQPANPILLAIVFASFLAAAVLPFFLAPTGGFKLELNESGATLVDWWRKRTFLWSDYEIMFATGPDGKSGSIEFIREQDSRGVSGQQTQAPKKREAVPLPDHFGMRSEDLATLMRRYRAAALGIPADSAPYMSSSWKG